MLRGSYGSTLYRALKLRYATQYICGSLHPNELSPHAFFAFKKKAPGDASKNQVLKAPQESWHVTEPEALGSSS